MSSTGGRAADWTTIAHRGHAVQFYSHEDQLLDQLARYIGTALVGGDAALVVATREHRAGLVARLRRRGFDVGVARRQQRFLAFDAAVTIERFAKRGRIDPQRFHHVFGRAYSRVAGAAGASKRVAAFGEMVALLWAARHHDAAIQLEQLWNDFIAQRNATLCCAYPMRLFENGDGVRFLRVCAQHTTVFPAGPRRHGKSTLELNPREEVAS